VGSGEQIRVGVDSILGCGEEVRLPAALINKLHEKDIYMLK